MSERYISDAQLEYETAFEAGLVRLNNDGDPIAYGHSLHCRCETCLKLTVKELVRTGYLEELPSGMFQMTPKGEKRTHEAQHKVRKARRRPC